MKLRKYVVRGTHPLAPFTIEVEATNVFDALAELQGILTLIGREAAEKPKEPVRTPANCANFKTAEKSSSKTLYYVTCQVGNRDHLFSVPVEAFDKRLEVQRCKECKDFKPRT